MSGLGAAVAGRPRRHKLRDPGGTATLLLLLVFLAPAAAWVAWQPPAGPAPGTELRMLVWSALLPVLLAVLQVVMHIRRFGGPAIRGNRGSYPRAAGAAGRIARAHANAVESLVPFAAVVLAAHAAGASDRWTAAASVLYLAARIVHATAYTAGVTIIRSAAFYAGAAATATIAVVALRALP